MLGELPPRAEANQRAQSHLNCGCSIAYKVLVDDDLWMVGANAQLVFPADSTATAFTTTVYPWFGTQAGENHCNTDGRRCWRW